MGKQKRISLCISDEEYVKWNALNHRESLSAFIREAVNEYIKIQSPDKNMTLFDIFLKQNSEFTVIREKLHRLERIEGELIDLTAALAKFEMIDIVQDQWEIKKKKII